MRDTPIIMAGDAQPEKLLYGVDVAKLRKGQKYPYDHDTGEKYRYLDLLTCFDIETSTGMIKRKGKERKHSWVYLWAWQFGDKWTVIGRTLEEFTGLVQRILQYMNAQYGNDVRLMCYVHKLEYEFIYLSGVWDFDTDDVFATDKRKVLYCKMGNLELRCSYRLSNSSLEDWCREFPNDHTKLSIDHDQVRYPWTELDDSIIQYCATDAICVVERVRMLMQMHGDTIYSIPYTQTGYIRREVKTAVKNWSMQGILEMQDTLDTYKSLVDAFRGADGYASRYWVNNLVGDVYCWDISSSYPAIMCHCKVPMTKFRDEEITGEFKQDFKKYQSLLNIGRAVLFKVGFKNIWLKDDKCGNPYIALDSCKRRGYTLPTSVVPDDKHVIAADYLEMTITDLDYEIIQSMYEWQDMKILWMKSARYGYLPRPVVDIVIEHYKAKVRLADHDEQQAEYNHEKRICNSVFGLFAQRVIQEPYLYDHGKWRLPTEEEFDEVTEYDKATKRAYTRYAWGCWVCCWGRYRLWQLIGIASKAWGKDAIRYPFLYADTDSVMSACEVDYSAFNKRRIHEAKQSGAYETDSNGKVHYMGAFEFKWKADLFRTLGIKKYAKVIDGELSITVSGIPKKRGADILKLDGGIEAFAPGYSFVGIENPTADYNDKEDFEVKIKGHKLHVTRNVVIVHVPFEMKIEKNYLALVNESQAILDALDHPHYNKKW